MFRKHALSLCTYFVVVPRVWQICQGIGCLPGNCEGQTRSLLTRAIRITFASSCSAIPLSLSVNIGTCCQSVWWQGNWCGNRISLVSAWLCSQMKVLYKLCEADSDLRKLLVHLTFRCQCRQASQQGVHCFVHCGCRLGDNLEWSTHFCRGVLVDFECD